MVLLNPGPAPEVTHFMHVLGKATYIGEQNRALLSEPLLYELVQTFSFAQNACDVTGLRGYFFMVIFYHQTDSLISKL